LVARIYSGRHSQAPNMERQSTRYLLRTNEGFEVDVTVDATGEYYSNLRTKAPPGSTKSQFDRAMLEVDIWLEDTFSRAPNKLTCLKEAPPDAYQRLKVATRPVRPSKQ
jgi:hypothetical protein